MKRVRKDFGEVKTQDWKSMLLLFLSGYTKTMMAAAAVVLVLVVPAVVMVRLWSFREMSR